MEIMNNFFKCLCLFVSSRKSEMAHLRLSSGAAMLKICEQKGVGDQFTSEQFYNLSLLMNVSKKCSDPLRILLFDK